jgi:serine/threonine-protein kinase
VSKRKETSSFPKILAESGSSIHLSTVELASEGPEDGLAAEAEATPVETGEFQAGRYRVAFDLGQGGMGRVMAADDAHLKRRVAIKQLHHHLHQDRDHLQDFFHEALVTAQLEHPNIVPIYDIGISDEGNLYFVMKRVSGQSLLQIIEALAKGDPALTAQYTLPRLLGIFQKVCMAVAFAHSRGVIHRDLKPENVMVGEHGVVYLMDWGLCQTPGVTETPRPRLPRPPSDSSELSAESAPNIAGTLGYLAPEQLSGQSPQGSVATDVFALGCMLYEILTRKPVYQGSAVTIYSRGLMGNFEPPRTVASDLGIPTEIEAICLKALSQAPEDRHSSAHELHDDIQLFLDGTAEKERRQRAAAVALREANELKRQYEQLWQSSRNIELEAYMARLLARTEPETADHGTVAPVAERLEEVEDQTVTTLARAIQRYREVLSLVPDHREAREKLAQLHWGRFVAAEQRGNRSEMLYHRQLLETFNDGQYDAGLVGDGVLRINTTPVEAEVKLLAYDEHEGVLIAGAPIAAGRTPFEHAPIPMGRYVAILKAEEHWTTRVPVLVERQGRPRITVTLRSQADVGPDFISIPGGPYIAGGDPTNPGAGPRRVEVVGDFAIARYPVTAAEYLAFINDLAAESPEKARGHVPRRRYDGDYYWTVGDDGRYRLPLRDPDGNGWHPRWPVARVSWDDARAYCDWLGERLGRPIRLPTSTEWEKAGRGVDGRIYPWGRRFTPSFCKMAESRRTRNVPEAVGSFPMDESPYGVRDMAGGVSEWCDGWFDEGRGLRPLYGMGFESTEFECRLTYVRGYGPHQVPSHAGFRVAHGF